LSIRQIWTRVSSGTTPKIGSIKAKHGVAFTLAQEAFFDPERVVAEDLSHSENERRYFCFGRVADGIMTVRFTWREGRIRIFGAGYWRKGKAIYEQQNR